jgi:diguanylate cyclase (GGDEF)-like protein
MSASLRAFEQMSIFSRLRTLLGSRLEWRLLAVFLAAALLPMAVSDWIATSVIGSIGQQLAHDRANAATRTASLQVFDRLLLAGTLLRAIDQADASTRSPLKVGATGARGPLASVACADADVPSYLALLNRWTTASSGSGVTMPAGASGTLRIAAARGGNADLLMATTAGAKPHCIAALNPDNVWEPVHDRSEDDAWVVHAEDGSTVLSWRSPEAAPPTAERGRTLDHYSSHLFLTSEFGAGNWTLEQSAVRPVVEWRGMPVAAWLLGVAAATLLIIGLVARRTIRRTLLPLEALTEGSRRLASGIEPARVDIVRGDELGRLAGSFNAMAAQLEQRIASLRTLAQIDAGILTGASFSDLARMALSRLVLLQPRARIAVAWRLDDLRIATIRHPVSDDRQSALASDVVEMSTEALRIFNMFEDGVVPSSSLVAIAAAVGCDPSGSSTVPCLVLGVRDGQTNRALISMELVDPGLDQQEARGLRDRLAVAVVARDREAQLEHRAAHDQLTGLSNLYGLQLALAPLLAREDKMAVLFIDLDHFKDVNDCYGHVVGDRLLQAAARRLQRSTPPNALLARNGGDEFVMILPDCDATQASETAARILEALRQPFIIATTEHRSAASIGIAMYPAHALDRDDLLRCADIAMYEAKREGRNRATLFRPEFDTLIRERNELLTGLIRALERAEFVVHYQPRLDAGSGIVVAAEALVRWQHPERGLTLPGEFIALAENSGLIDALGLVVMETAIVQIAEWHRQGVAIRRVSVNVSQHQFASGSLVDDVRALLQRHGVAGDRLEIEVTESVLGGDIASVRRQLHELRSLGVAIAMDDFGTGYSSLSQLRTLPIDVMKIDRAFVKDLETDPDAVAIARTIVTLARALDLHIVAEGIETPAQAAMLSDMGCDQFQGFLYSEPLPPLECAALGRFEVPAMAPRSA